MGKLQIEIRNTSEHFIPLRRLLSQKQTITGIGRMWGNSNPQSLLVGIKMVRLEKTIVFFKNQTQDYHMIQQFHYQIYTQEDGKQGLEQVRVSEVSIGNYF